MYFQNDRKLCASVEEGNYNTDFFIYLFFMELTKASAAKANLQLIYLCLKCFALGVTEVICRG